MDAVMENYGKMQSKTNEEITQLEEQIKEMKTTLDSGIVMGDIVVGDQLYT